MTKPIPKTIDKIVAENLYKLRHSMQKSQAEMSKATGFSVAYVSMLERGSRCPTLKTLDAYAKAFNIPISELVVR